jgi:lyso-ornithine lipid O-acyltransferase
MPSVSRPEGIGARIRDDVAWRIGLALRLALLALAYLIVVAPQLVAVRLSLGAAGKIPVLFHRLILFLFGVRVTEKGRPPGQAATLVLSNHVSWLDIPVIGSLHPVSFIAKSDVDGWPVIGHLARLQRSVFIDRQRRRATADVNRAVAERLSRGDVIVLFAEGTTGDGNRILPFRSSLVGAARATLDDHTGAKISVVPLAITYTRRNGLPVGRRERPEIAWYGDMELVPHLGLFARRGPLDAVVIWGDPILFNGDRKEATLAAESAVRAAIRFAGAGS